MDSNWLREYNYLTFDVIDSTNSEARRVLSRGADGNFVISAGEQISGRGRNGRIWESRPGNLYMSILLEADGFYNRQSDISFVTALAVYDSISEISRTCASKVDLIIKWPNDILINGAKISGILLESIKSNAKHYLIIGIGVNIALSPNLSDKKTISCADLNIKNISPSLMLDIIMKHFSYYYNLWQDKGFTPVRQLWLERSCKRGEVITVSDGRNRISGLFQDIDENGAIVLKLASGEHCKLSTGDVFFGTVY